MGRPDEAGLAGTRRDGPWSAWVAGKHLQNEVSWGTPLPPPQAPSPGTRAHVPERPCQAHHQGCESWQLMKARGGVQICGGQRGHQPASPMPTALSLNLRLRGLGTGLREQRGLEKDGDARALQVQVPALNSPELFSARYFLFPGLTFSIFKVGMMPASCSYRSWELCLQR